MISAIVNKKQKEEQVIDMTPYYVNILIAVLLFAILGMILSRLNGIIGTALRKIILKIKNAICSQKNKNDSFNKKNL